MTKSIIYLITILLIGGLFISSCNEVVDEQCNDKDELMATIDKFYASIENNDVETRGNLFTENAIMLPNHWTPHHGKERISEIIKSAENSVFKIKDRELLDMDIDGNLAYTVNSYYYTWHEADDSAQWHKTKNVHIWKKVNGEWKLHLDIWNSDVPMSQFELE